MKKLAAIDISLCAVCIALHIVLEVLPFTTIRIGNDVKITLAALPFLIIAFLCGPVEAMITGLLGTFLSQLLTFGLTPTTPLWLIPYAVQALMAGLLFAAFRHKINIKVFSISIFASGLAAVILNLLASYVDGVILYKYLTMEALLAILPVRLLVWAGVSVVYILITLPVTKALIRSCPAGIRIARRASQV